MLKIKYVKNFILIKKSTALAKINQRKRIFSFYFILSSEMSFLEGIL